MRFSPALALCLLAQSALAQTYMGMDRFVGPTAPATPTPPSANCPYGNSLGDGCPGALTTATQQTTGLFTSAPQLGQTYQTASFTGSVSGTTLTVSAVTGTINPNGHLDTLLGSGIPTGTTIISGSGPTYTLSANLGTVGSESMTTQFRPTWNVAGVEYPVGAPPANTLTDASTLPVCSGATYSVCLNATYPNVVEILGPNSGSNVILDHYDFSLHGGYEVLVWAGTTISGDLTISNSKFAFGSAFQPGGSVYSFLGGCNGGTMFGYYNPGGNSQVTGNTTQINNEYNGMADTGGSTINCPGGTGTVSIAIPGSASSNNIFEYNYVHDVSTRFEFGWGATVKYNLISNINYNTPAHGESTAFNVCFSSCTGVSTIYFAFNTFTQNQNYAGGMTAPVFFGSGINSPVVTDVTNKNNTYLLNGARFTATNSSPGQAGCTGTSGDGANCQLTLTTADGVAGPNTLFAAGFNICTAAGTASSYIQCPATLETQLSGTSGGSGVYRYASGNGISGSSVTGWMATASSPSAAFTGESYRNVDSENNYIDGTGAGNFADEPSQYGDCAVAATAAILHPASGSITSSNNKWMTGTFLNGTFNYGQFSFTTCTKFSEGLIAGSTSGTTLSVTVDSVFTGNINVDDADALHATAITSGTIQTGDTDSILDTGGNVQRGTQILNQTSGTAGGVGVYSITNPTQTVTSQTMTAAQLFGTINSGGRTDTLFGNGVTPGAITITSGVCAVSGCVTSYGLGSSPGSLSSRFFVTKIQ